MEAPQERLLPTMNRDGSRNWINPRVSKGRYFQARRIVAAGLILLFVALPFLRVGGKQSILLDIVGRKFVFFGATFFPTDSFLLLTLTFALCLGIFLFTALLGRLWCGWACIQTVYMEFVFRPIERWIEGPRWAEAKLVRRILKHAIYAIVSLAMSWVFLAYFVGPSLGSRSPFVLGALVTIAGLIHFNYGYFREQTCLIACPYGRFQSVLLDSKSLVVAYDGGRGEPRARERQRKMGGAYGDCIDCTACVATCPTGIDIRDGLQMECINCTQCIDACDRIMERVRKPRGLIRYLPQDPTSSGPRVRVLVYSALFALSIAGFVWALASRRDAEVSILKNESSPWMMMGNDEVASLYRVRIKNATETPQQYTISISGLPNARLICPTNPLKVAPLKQETAVVFVVVPKDAPRGKFTIEVTDGRNFRFSKSLELAGRNQ